jgi:hypothetical protein
VTEKKQRELIVCSKSCIDNDVSCPNQDCRHWISYEDELNCSLISIYVNGRMTLQQIGERLDISFVRVCQIEKKIKEKLRTNPNLLKLFKK